MEITILRNNLKERKTDAAMFISSEKINDVNIQYFTKFQKPSFSVLLIDQRKSVLITSSLDYDRALKEAKVDEIINLKDYDNSVLKVLKEKLKKGALIGVLESIFPYGLVKKLKGFKIKDISDIILEMRSVKKPREIRLIKKSCDIANKGIKFLEKNISRKITEKELSLILKDELIKKGADELAFPTIITSGKRSAYIHPYPSVSNNKLQRGLGLIDFGVRYKEYCSDVTLPFSIGKLSKKEKSIIETVQLAYKKSLENLAINISTHKLYEIAENIIKDSGYEFKHSLGHGLGLDVHDLPRLSQKPKTKEDLKNWKETKLKANMIFTIEPGIYVPRIGGCRIENDILLTKKDPKVLTKSIFLEF